MQKDLQIQLNEMRKELDACREKLSQAYIELSGKKHHWSDCAVYNAPAMDPCKCDCKCKYDRLKKCFGSL